ncbi:MAG: hypothetical protein JKX69_03910 [Rhodobacteraceae bacterium]|nr:hypothetical protein [Paracoccaceae bacterium]PHR51152.1 MAG: hypothetical protein COA47_18240 [Robiginitomaculum sp.]
MTLTSPEANVEKKTTGFIRATTALVVDLIAEYRATCLAKKNRPQRYDHKEITRELARRANDKITLGRL